MDSRANILKTLANIGSPELDLLDLNGLWLFERHVPLRTASVSTVAPTAQDGTAYVTWDNINSWWLAKYVSRTV